MSVKIKVYSATWCSVCKTLKAFLDKEGVVYEELLLDDAEIMKKAKDLGIRSIPVTYVNEYRFDGSSDITLQCILNVIKLKGVKND